MKRTAVFSIVGVICSILIITGCVPADKMESKRLQVYSSIYPLQYFAERIGGEEVDVHTIVPPGVEPHDFELSAKDVIQLNEADMVLYNGRNLEPWLEKNIESIDHNQVEVINTSQDIKALDDPHIWLNPLLAKKQAEVIKDAFVARDPTHQSTYDKNYEQLGAELDQLDQEYFDMVQRATQKSFLVSHAAFTHLADRYGLEQISVSGLSPSDEPSPQALKKIIEEADKKKIGVIYLETLVSGKLAEVVQNELKLTPSVLNPLEGLTEIEMANEDDYFTVMRRNKEHLMQGLGVKP
ncbi:zinc ABC transporter substrate-binding protein [Hazenella sp. IB182353]|uniref:metal ABC transporter substrate-binding protein n=1 Tax=Polycladospora coralii TaxID=2771432 RepID=UPI00174635D6|nr:zinc ABC transporter substrate-binding protein [Polycladospora coralii]MBS7530543.1 zinc ABC transporter substrate-binding protein [Polycladospora coralii]